MLCFRLFEVSLICLETPIQTCSSTATRRILHHIWSDWAINYRIYTEGRLLNRKKRAASKPLVSNHPGRYSFQWLEQKPHGPQTPRPLHHVPFSPICSSHQDEKSPFPPSLPSTSQIIYLLYHSRLKTFNLSMKHQDKEDVNPERLDTLKFFLLYINTRIQFLVATWMFFKTQTKRLNSVISETTQHKHFQGWATA